MRSHFVISLLPAILLTPMAAHAAPLPEAIVALGDSLASGEGAGNYLDSKNPDCHRSRNAELAAAGIPNVTYIALACSGAETKHVLNTAQSGERPQLEQLAGVARSYRITMVLVTIGANDLGVHDIAARCAVDYMLGKTCADQEDAALRNKLAVVRSRIELVLARIQATLAEAGQPDVRLVLQSYPSPIAVVNQYDSKLARLAHGCPFADSDAAWARTVLMPTIAQMMNEAARSLAVEFIDITPAMDGREACSPGNTPKWTNGVKLRRAAGSPELEGPNPELENFNLEPEGLASRESLHPNRLGHAALGHCLAQFYTQRGNGVCQQDGGELTFWPIPFE